MRAHRDTVSRIDPRQHCRGAAAVEFALILVLLMTILACVVEGGRVLWFYDALAKSARDAARHMSVINQDDLGKNDSSDNAKDFILKAAQAANLPGLVAGDIAITCHRDGVSGACQGLSADTAKTVKTISVSIDYPLTIGELIPFIPVGSGTLGQFEIHLRPETTMPYMW